MANQWWCVRNALLPFKCYVLNMTVFSFYLKKRVSYPYTEDPKKKKLIYPYVFFFSLTYFLHVFLDTPY